jgi:hypothetical protein
VPRGVGGVAQLGDDPFEDLPACRVPRRVDAPEEGVRRLLGLRRQRFLRGLLLLELALLLLFALLPPVLLEELLLALAPLLLLLPLVVLLLLPRHLRLVACALMLLLLWSLWSSPCFDPLLCSYQSPAVYL